MRKIILIIILVLLPTIATAEKWRNPLDGYGGFLWKPCSDHGCGLVILQRSNRKPTSYRWCRVYKNNPEGTLKRKHLRENLHYTGRSNPDRPTWRADLHGGEYDGRFVCLKKNGVKKRWQIPGDTAERGD